MKKFVIVVYDISNDRRRTRLHRKLKDFGNPVQYSVFECLLENKEIEILRKDVKKIIRPRLDHVRFYYLCNRCMSKTEITGRKELSEEKKVVVV